MRDLIEEAVGNLYAELFKLRQEGKLQEEYDTMGTLVSLLTQDRQHMRVKYAGKIRI